MHEVFISYSNKDQNLADAVVSILEASRIKCWIAYRDACVGEDYAASIIRAIKDCKACVLILSEKSNESKHVLSEINSCVNYGVTIIPLRIADVMFGDALEYYLGKTHWLDALTDPIEEHINRLGERINILLKKNVETNIPAAKGTSPIHVFNHPKVDVMSTRMVKYQELLSFGYNADKIAMQLMENDYVTCNGIGDDNQGNAGQWAQFVQNSTETFQYLINGENKIVGDWSILALSPEMFAQAKAGELLEKDISFNVSEMIIFPGRYYGYILMISVMPDYRSMPNYMKVMTSFFQQLEEYAAEGIFFEEWCMNVFSVEIENLVKKLGFKYLIDNKSFGKIYHMDFLPLPNNPFINKFTKLMELYAEEAKND